jgi:hypothetical protein
MNHISLRKLFSSFLIFFLFLFLQTISGIFTPLTPPFLKTQKAFAAGESWYNSSWTYRKKITIDHTKVASDEANFPVLVSLVGLSNINANGTDIRFTSSDGIAELPREIESYSSGSLRAWVKVPTLFSSSDTVIYMYYGNSDATEPAAGSTYGSQNVWKSTGDTSAAMVQHMKDATTSTITDSTSNANNGTKKAANEPIEADAKIAKGQTFDGTDDYVASIGAVSSYSFIQNTQVFTISAWIKLNSTTARQAIVANTGTTSDKGFYFMFETAGAGYGSKALRFSSVKGGGATIINAQSPDNSITDTLWHHVVVTGTGSGNNITFYIDGTARTTTYNTGFLSLAGGNSTNVLAIGTLNPTSPLLFFNGTIDETRIYNRALTAQEITTQYNNQNSPATFYSLSQNPTALNNWSYRKTITIDHTKVSSDQTNFPVLINLPSDASLASHAQTSGNDILFTASSTSWGTGTENDKLDHEIEKFNSATGELQAWVRIPALSSTVDTVLYMYYGNAVATNQQNKPGVWSTSTAMVQHLAETSGTHYDSTANANNGTPHNGVVQGTTGQIDGADSFDGVNDYIDASNGASLNIGNDTVLSQQYVQNTSTEDAWGWSYNLDSDHIMLITRQGPGIVAESGDGKIVKNIYTISTNTWSGYTTIYDSAYNDFSSSGGKIGNRLFSFIIRTTLAAPLACSNFVDYGYIYSDDNGTTWSSYNHLFDWNTGGMTCGQPLGGHMWQVGSTYYISYYRYYTDSSLNRVSVLKSDDNGTTWVNAYDLPFGDAARHPSENEIVYLGNNKLLALARNDIISSSEGRLIQSVSSDNGETWTPWAESNLGSNTYTNAPSMVYDSETNKIIVLYFDRLSVGFYYAINSPDDVFNNSVGWKSHVLTGGGGAYLNNPTITNMSSGKYMLFYDYGIRPNASWYYYILDLMNPNTFTGSQITAEAWVKAPSLGTDTQIIFSKVIDAFNIDSIRIPPGGKIRIYRDVNHVLSYEDSTSTVPNNVWTHIAYTGNGSDFHIYINGVDANAVQVGGTHFVNWSVAANLLIGARIGSGYFNGSIDEARIYSRTLSAGEITTQYSNQYSPSTFYALGSEEYSDYNVEYFDHFVVTGTGTMTAGSSQTITITANTNLGNTYTAYTGDKSLTFSGANAYSGGSSPTCSDKTNADIPFGTATTLTFTNGIATCTLKLYKVESATITATDGTYNANSNYLAVTVTDTTPPSAFTLSSPANNSSTSSAQPTLSWNASSDAESGLAKYQLYIDGSLNRDNISSSSASTTPVSALSDGNHTWYIVAVDAAGNTTQSTSTWTIKVDTAVSTGSSSSSSSNSSSSTSAPSCGDQAPGAKAPWLYGAIAQDSGSVLLYFTQADNPVNKYVLEYGTKSGDYPYGVQDMGVNSRGQMTFLVKSLSPDTTYYFKIRSGNGCATGSWSNEISAKTKGLVSFNQLDITQSELESKPVEETPPTTTTCQTYTVKSGDGLWSIAENLLGDGNRYKEIIEQNKDKYPSLQTSNNLEAGWKLKVNCGKQTTSETQNTPATQAQGGYDVKIKVVDTNKKPVEGAKVTIHSKVQETVTNKDGIAQFKNVEAGDHKVLIAYNNFEGEQSVNLTGNVKEFDLNVTVQQKAIILSPLAYGIIGIMGLVMIGLIVLLIKAKRKK